MFNDHTPEPAQRGDGARTDLLLTDTLYLYSLFLFIFPRWPWIGDSSLTTLMACLESRGTGRAYDMATTHHRHHHHIIPLVIPIMSGVLCLLSLSLLSDSFFQLATIPPRFGISQTFPSFGPAIIPLSLYIICHYCTTLSLPLRVLLLIVPHPAPHHPTPY